MFPFVGAKVYKIFGTTGLSMQKIASCLDFSGHN
jgi:hypothetical protein